MTSFFVRTAETLSDLDLTLPPGRWCVLLAMDATEISTDHLSETIERLLVEGMVYLCTWGPDCERVHDICDEILVLQQIDGLRSADSDTDLIMTTWHANDTLADAAWFAVHTAKPAEDYEATFGGTVALVVGLDEQAAQRVADAARHPCPCCGYLTFVGPPPDDADDENALCPVCGWISDGLQNSQPKASGMPNILSLEKSRENFAQCGAANPGDDRVRPPMDAELPRCT